MSIFFVFRKLLALQKKNGLVIDRFRMYTVEYARPFPYSTLILPQPRVAMIFYVFVSEDVGVKSFKTLDMEVSDHLPLVLEFE